MCKKKRKKVKVCFGKIWEKKRRRPKFYVTKAKVYRGRKTKTKESIKACDQPKIVIIRAKLKC